MKFLKQSVLALLACFFTLGCVAQVSQAQVLKSTPSQDGLKYLGDGYNSLTKGHIYQFQALEFPNGAVETPGGSQTNYRYFYANSKYELEQEVSSIFGKSVNAGYSIVTANASGSKEVVNQTKFSKETTTVIGYWRQFDKIVCCKDLPKLTDAALLLLQNDPKKFIRTYGDQYVSAVTLGRMYFIIYQAQTSSLSESRKTAVKEAMGLQVGSYVGGSLTKSQEEYIKTTMSNITVTCSAVGTGIPYFTGITKPEDIANIRNLATLSESAVLAEEYANFSQTSNSAGYTFFDVSEYQKMVDKWNTHSSNLEYIVSNPRVSTLLKDDCKAALNNINTQLNLAYAFDGSARYPTVETSTFNSLYSRYLTEMNIRPVWKPVSGSSTSVNYGESVDIDCGSIGDVDSILIGASGSQRGGTVILYYVESGNAVKYSQYTPSSTNWSTVLYTGPKFQDKFRIAFSVPSRPSAALKHGGNLRPISTYCNYLEKMSDVIWLYLKVNAPQLLPSAI